MVELAALGDKQNASCLASSGQLIAIYFTHVSKRSSAVNLQYISAIAIAAYNKRRRYCSMSTAELSGGADNAIYFHTFRVAWWRSRSSSLPPHTESVGAYIAIEFFVCLSIYCFELIIDDNNFLATSSTF